MAIAKRNIQVLHGIYPGQIDTPQLSIVILSALPGKRMKSCGPKPLYDVNQEQKLIDRQLKILKTCFPNSEIILSVGFEAAKVVRAIPGIKFIENTKFDNTNITEEIRLAINNITNNYVLFVGGDYLFDSSIKKVISTNSTIISSNIKEEDSVGMSMDGNSISIFAYGVEPYLQDIFFLRDKELEILRRIINLGDKSQLFLFELLNLILNNNGKLYPISIDNIIKLDTLSKLEKLCI